MQTVIIWHAAGKEVNAVQSRQVICDQNASNLEFRRAAIQNLKKNTLIEIGHFSDFLTIPYRKNLKWNTVNTIAINKTDNSAF